MKLIKKYSPLMESFKKKFYQSLETLSEDLMDLGIEFCVIGGLAVNHYGETRMTEDIDILVDRKNMESIKTSPISIFRKKTGSGRSLIYQKTKTPVDVIYSGDDAGSLIGSYSLKSIEIEVDSHGIPFISLYDLIKIKLSIGDSYPSRTYKDHADVISLIKENSLPKSYMLREGQKLSGLYELLWERANDAKDFIR